MKIFPSPTTQNISELQAIFTKFNPIADGYHLDIMDGEFVPNRMGSVKLVNQTRTFTKHPLWVHLMVQDPTTYIDTLILHQEDIVSFHYESVKNQAEVAQQIKNKGLRASMAINPQTPYEVIANACRFIDHILVMSVEPGKSGQKFLPEILTKLKFLQAFRANQECTFSIGVDGGITKKVLSKLQAYNIEQAAITSAIFSQDDSIDALQELKKISSR